MAAYVTTDFAAMSHSPGFYYMYDKRNGSLHGVLFLFQRR